MQTLIIINNVAARARRAWPIIERQLSSSGIEYEAYMTKGPGDAISQTRAALKTGTTTIAVVGGDGTLSEAAEGFFDFHQDVETPPLKTNYAASLAILPAGTGDDFARGLRGTRAPLEKWIDVLVRHCRAKDNHDATTRLTDVLYGLCNGYRDPFICLNASTMGIGGETATRVAAQGNVMRKLPGELRFAIAAIKALAVWRERRVRVVVDDQLLVDGPINLAAVANALYAGGGMKLSPEARFDDGKLDVVTASGLTRASVVRELSRIYRGGHVANPRVNIKQGQIVRIETFSPRDAMPLEADGNVRGFTPVQFELLPRALRFVV